MAGGIGRRVSVVGCSGSGKTTLARALAERLEVPHVELDSIYHQPDWTPLPDDLFLAEIRERTAGPGWVVDGNYSTVRPHVWSRAESVVWVDLPRAVVMRAILWRSLSRGLRRAELWNGNRERLRNLLRRSPEENIVLWAWTTHGKLRERYGAAMRDPGYAHLSFHRLESREAVVGFLDRLSPRRGA